MVQTEFVLSNTEEIFTIVLLRTASRARLMHRTGGMGDLFMSLPYVW